MRLASLAAVAAANARSPVQQASNQQLDVLEGQLAARATDRCGQAPFSRKHGVKLISQTKPAVSVNRRVVLSSTPTKQSLIKQHQHEGNISSILQKPEVYIHTSY